MHSSLWLLAASSIIAGAGAAPFSDSHLHLHPRSRPHKAHGRISAHVDLPPTMPRLLVARDGVRPLLSSSRRKGAKPIGSPLPFVDLSIPYLTTPKHVVLRRRRSGDDEKDTGDGRAHSMASYDPYADDEQGSSDDAGEYDDAPSSPRRAGNNFAADDDEPTLRNSDDISPAADDERASAHSFRKSDAASDGGSNEGDGEDEDAAPTRSSSGGDEEDAPVSRKPSKSKSSASDDGGDDAAPLDDGDARGLKSHKPASTATDDGPAASPALSSSRLPRPHSYAKAGTSADCTALQTIFADMGGASWTRTDGWTDDSADCCLAYGVGCASGRVRTLDLARNGLVGNLSTAVFDLDALTRLCVVGSVDLR